MSPLHIGTGKENYDFSASELQSDTISSALASIRAQNGKTGDIEDFLNSFSVSSAFPFWKDYYFLPKIQGKLNVRVKGQDEHQYRKKLKKVQFIESSIWQKLASGVEVEIEEGQIQKEFILPVVCQSDFKISKSQVSQRVSVPRGDGQEAEPFFFDWRYFSSDAGLYCLVDTDTKKFDEIKTLFEQLGVWGIGTDRNVGGGKFEVEHSSLEITEPNGANMTVLLSLYIPGETEFGSFDLDNSRYNLVLRGGYISGSDNENFRHLRKKSVYMFDVGSVFPLQNIAGKIVNLRPKWEGMHDIFRSGKPLTLPIKMQ